MSTLPLPKHSEFALAAGLSRRRAQSRDFHLALLLLPHLTTLEASPWHLMLPPSPTSFHLTGPLRRLIPLFPLSVQPPHDSVDKTLVGPNPLSGHSCLPLILIA